MNDGNFSQPQIIYEKNIFNSTDLLIGLAKQEMNY